MPRLVVVVSGTSGPAALPSGPVVAINENNSFMVNKVPTLLMVGQNMSYNTWTIGAYAEAEADAMIQQAVSAGVNVAGSTDTYPYTNPVYVGRSSIEVMNRKFGRLWMNASAGKPDRFNEAANILALLASTNAQYRLVWNYFSEPNMDQYVTTLAQYQLIGQLDPTFPINCTEAIRQGTTHGYGSFFDSGAVGDSGFWDEVVQSNGLQVPIVEFAQSGNAEQLWTYLYFMNRRVRSVSTAAPSSTPVAASGGAGALTGTYKFVYTWSYGTGYLDPDAVESFASPESAPITVSGNQIVVSGLTGPPTTGKINLWGFKDGVSQPNGAWPTSGYACIAAALPSSTTSYTVTADSSGWFQATIPPRVAQLGWIPSISTTLAGELFGWNALNNTIPTVGALASGSAVVTAVPDTSLMVPLMNASGANIPAGTQIVSVDSGTQITLSQAVTGSGTQPITISAVPSSDQTRRWWWLQVAMNCRAFEWYFADWLRGPGGNNDPVVGPLSQNTKIALVSSNPTDARVCSIEGILSDGVTIAREDTLTLAGTTPVQTTNTYSSIKWVACHRPTPACEIDGSSLSSGSAAVTGIPTDVLQVGMSIAASGGLIPAGTLIASIDSATQLTMTQNATGTTTNARIFPGYPVTGTVTSGSAVVTVPSTALLKTGMTISGTAIPTGTQILSVDSGTQFTMTHSATGSHSGESLTVGHTITFTEVATGKNILVNNPFTASSKYNTLALPSGDSKLGGMILCASGNNGLPNGYLQQWNDTATVVGQITSLSAVIVAPGQWQRIAAVTPTFAPFNDAQSGTHPKGLYAATKTAAGVRYVIAINWDEQNPVGYDRTLLGATINVGQTITSVVRIAGESGSPSHAGSVITDDFTPSQVHVYQIT